MDHSDGCHALRLATTFMLALVQLAAAGTLGRAQCNTRPGPHLPGPAFPGTLECVNPMLLPGGGSSGGRISINILVPPTVPAPPGPTTTSTSLSSPHTFKPSPHLDVLVQDEEVHAWVAVLVPYGTDHDLATA